MRCPHCGAARPDDARFCGACGRASTGTEPSYKDLTGAIPAQAPDLVGREVAGRYRVLAKLGEGGMGAVYRGEQLSLKRKVAIKVLRPELSRDPGLVRRFNAEAELAARLSHPNTVNIYDFGQDADGALFIAMEFLEGRSLRDVMTHEGPLPPARAVVVAQQIAASLADAHAHGIVHRDLKPDNVMLTERGKDRDVVRVLDFGIAKLRDDDRQTVNAMTRAGDLIGTPQYMAPEQIRGEQVDGRTDVYALGAMLYEMVTGRLPFEGPTVMAILSRHLTDTPEPPMARRPDLGLPPALDHLIMAALAKDPAHRQPTMERLGEDLAALAVQLGAARSAAMPASVPLSAPPFAPPGPPPGPPPPGPAPTGPAPVGGYATPPPPPVAIPAGPPPGVPRSYPPGVLQPLPPPGTAPPYAGAPAPYAPASAPPGQGGYAPPPGHVGPAPTPAAYVAHAPAASSSRAPIIIAVLVVLAAAGGVAAFFLLDLGGKKKAGDRVEDPGDDPWGAGADPTPDDDGDEPDDEPAPRPPPSAGAWAAYRDPTLGWGLRLPPGVSTTPVFNTGAYNFAGMQRGVTINVGAFAVPNQGNTPSTAELDLFANQLASSLGAQVTEAGYVATRGVNRYRVVMDASGERAEARFYIEPHVILMAYYTRDRDWDGSAGERREFFEGVTLPGGM